MKNRQHVSTVGGWGIPMDEGLLLRRRIQWAAVSFVEFCDKAFAVALVVPPGGFRPVAYVPDFSGRLMLPKVFLRNSFRSSRGRSRLKSALLGEEPKEIVRFKEPVVYFDDGRSQKRCVRAKL